MTIQKRQLTHNITTQIFSKSNIYFLNLITQPSMSDSDTGDELAPQKEAEAITFRSLGIKDTLCEAIAGLGECVVWVK
jgi:hypothetical protein